ncbi:hypothetical protein FACS189462_1200 [Spirochaetia bacterium]|nr:hypothetical protein FACS189462_1200 [Spirochaetia bacterium]
MKKPFVPAALIPLALLLFSCGTTGPASGTNASGGKAPLWVDNPQDAYPDSDWLYAVETGKDRNATESAALTSLVQLFGVDAQAVTMSSQDLVNKVQRSNGKETSETAEIRRLSQDLTTIAAVSGLIDVQRDVWTDRQDNTVYASARMNRAEGAVRYKALIEENEALINNLKASAEKTAGTFDAYETLSLAAGVADLTDNFYTILGVLQPKAAAQRPAYGSADAIRALLREQAALIVVRVEVSGDVDSRISKAFASIFSKRGFRTAAAPGAAPALKPYTLKADMKLEDVQATDPRYKFTRFVLTASLMSQNGAELLSWSENDREGHPLQQEARQRAILQAEMIITESGFAKEFDAYLDSL